MWWNVDSQVWNSASHCILTLDERWKRKISFKTPSCPVKIPVKWQWTEFVFVMFDLIVSLDQWLKTLYMFGLSIIQLLDAFTPMDRVQLTVERLYRPLWRHHVWTQLPVKSLPHPTHQCNNHPALALSTLPTHPPKALHPVMQVQRDRRVIQMGKGRVQVLGPILRHLVHQRRVLPLLQQVVQLRHLSQVKMFSLVLYWSMLTCCTANSSYVVISGPSSFQGFMFSFIFFANF